MPAAILTQGKQAIRDTDKALVTHIGVATDQTAFAVGQTVLDPANGGAANLLIKSATKTDVDADTFDATITINGDSEFTGKAIYTTAAMDGATRSDPLTRTVRGSGLGIGVQAGDVFTVGIRWSNQDDS